MELAECLKTVDLPRLADLRIIRQALTSDTGRAVSAQYCEDAILLLMTDLKFNLGEDLTRISVDQLVVAARESLYSALLNDLRSSDLARAFCELVDAANHDLILELDTAEPDDQNGERHLEDVDDDGPFVTATPAYMIMLSDLP